jgi:hypothetical protein
MLRHLELRSTDLSLLTNLPAKRPAKQKYYSNLVGHAHHLTQLLRCYLLDALIVLIIHKMRSRREIITPRANVSELFSARLTLTVVPTKIGQLLEKITLRSSILYENTTIVFKYSFKHNFLYFSKCFLDSRRQKVANLTANSFGNVVKKT